MDESSLTSSLTDEDRKPITLNERYINCKQIGEGTFGVVFKGTDKNEANPEEAVVAIKAIRLNSSKDGYIVHLTSIVRECLIMKKLKHNNIISCRDIFYKLEHNALKRIWIVMPFMPTDLSRILNRHSTGLVVNVTRGFMMQILQGLHYLHSAKVVHRDMKPGNMLVSMPACLLKICDFGQARTMLPTSGKLTPRGIGTWAFKSPELLVENETYDSKADIWSAGVTLQYMMSGECLFRTPNVCGFSQIKTVLKLVGKSPDDDLSWINDATYKSVVGRLAPVEKDLKILFPLGNPQALDLLTKMLILTPAARISALEALSHPFFENEQNSMHLFPPFEHPEQLNIEGKTTKDMLDLLEEEITTFNQT